MYGCGNPFKHFFCKIFAPPFYFDPGECSALFDHSNPLTFVSMHSQPYFMSPNSLVSSTYPWKFLKVNSSSLPHKFKLTPSQFAQRLPRFLSTFTTLYLSKLTWPTPSTTSLALPLPHLRSPYSMSAFSGILLHLQHIPPLYMYVSVNIHTINYLQMSNAIARARKTLQYVHYMLKLAFGLSRNSY
jgi:hypothetical protein